MRTIAIISGLMLVCTSGAIAAAQTSQGARPQTATATPAPEPGPTPTAGEPAGKSISEQGVKGPAPDRPKPRPTPKPGVKFGQE